MSESKEEFVAAAPPGYERSDANVWGIVGFGIALAVAAVVVHLVIYWLFFHFEEQEKQARPETLWYAQLAEEPLQQPTIEGIQPFTDMTDVARVQRPKEEMAETYDWIDQKAGLARIPVEKAIDILVASDQLRSRKVEKGRCPPQGWQWPSGSSSGRHEEEMK